METEHDYANQGGHPEVALSELGEPIVQRALSYYDTQLKPTLEPDHRGEMVAIHADSGDYELGQRFGATLRALRRRHAVGPIVVHTIGDAVDFGLASRALDERSEK